MPRPGIGSIPACAGEPWPARRRTTGNPVYPRVCGGATQHVHPPSQSAGLSPRVRGSLDGERIRRIEQGSIPACAGEPRCKFLVPLRPWRTVYPRVCGGAELNAGGVATDGTGSIPACAGEPFRRRSRPDCGFVVRVYPRVCGGATIRIDAEDLEKGLSPRVRGSRSMGVAIVRRNGSIPACAGEPTAGGPGGKSGRVYPRVCGGATIRSTHCGPSKGLSPRVRGSRSVAGQHARHRGSIPACAGEPPTWTR